MANMSKIESLLAEARSLSNAERCQLAELLLKEAAQEVDADEINAGERGLLAWAEAALQEDWAAFYPAGLGKGKAAPP